MNCHNCNRNMEAYRPKAKEWITWKGNLVIQCPYCFFENNMGYYWTRF